MLKDENKKESFPALKKEYQQPDKKNQESGSASGVVGGNNPEKDPKANLFEEHIREEKKEGA